MKISFSTSRPIYLQIMEQIKGMIARNELSQGNKLPSQREMAVQMGVNPNTIQRVYRELEAEGFVETLRGQGTFVSSNKNIVAGVKQELIQKALQEFYGKMQSLGLDAEQITALLHNYLLEKKGGNGP